MVETNDADLAAIFFLALYATVLIPYTIYSVCYPADQENVVKPWVQSGGKESMLSKCKRFVTRSHNLTLLILWALFLALVVYAQAVAKEKRPFDPFAILQLEPGATAKDVKRAYRQLSLRYHPDKNPDPAANKYFAEFITKAYKALSDPIGKKNYEEHGHPDGHQSITMGIGLPQWLFDGDSRTAPLLLAILVFGGVLLPLGAAACYLLSSNKFNSAGVIEETTHNFMMPPYGIRQSQGLPRILETLTIAVEYITMPTLPSQLPAMEQLRKETLRRNPDLRDKKSFWQRKPSCIKANMLLLAHLDREPIAPELHKDWLYVTDRAAPLCAMMVDLSAYPRTHERTGWLAPTIGSIEFLQHLIQAVPTAARRNAGVVRGAVDGPAPLQQLPHLHGAEALRGLSRKRVRSLSELQGLPATERQEALQSIGLTAKQVGDVETSLSSMPTLSVEVQCSLAGGGGETSYVAGDLVTCTASVLLSRPSHAVLGPDKSGSGVAVFSPHFPHPRVEKWFFFIADVAANETVSQISHLSLVEAEFHSATQQAQSHQNGHASKMPSKHQTMEATQKVTIPFVIRSSVKRQYALFVMCDSWIGCDLVLPLNIKVVDQTRAEREGRAPRSGRVIPLDEFGNPEEAVDGPNFEDDGTASEGGDEDEDDYDTDESGTEESGSDEEEETLKDAPAEGVVPKAGVLQTQSDLPA